MWAWKNGVVDPVYIIPVPKHPPKKPPGEKAEAWIVKKQEMGNKTIFSFDKFSLYGVCEVKKISSK